MNPQESLAQLRDSIPKLRQFLADTSQRVADAETKARIEKAVGVFDENFARIETELPALFDDLNARKAKAEAAIQHGLDELASLRETLAAKAEAAKAEIEAKKLLLMQQKTVVAADDPELGGKLREGLLARYVSASPHRRVDVKSPSFEDWADSVVNLTIPPVDNSTSETAASNSLRGRTPPSSFESWLDSGRTDNLSSDSGKELTDEEIRQRRQDVLNYYRKDAE